MLTFSSLVQSILSGVVEGITYSLYCLGLAFVFGIMRVINLSHGEFLVLGGYVAYWCLIKFGLDPLLSLPLAAGVAGLTALLSYRVFLQRIRMQPELNTLILTYGLGIFLANLYLQLWTADIRSIGVDFWEYPLTLGGVYMSRGEIAAVVVSLSSVLGLHYFLTRTRLGMAIRVTAIDRDAAACAGINVARADLLAFTIGGVMAGLGGPLFGMLSHVSPGAGVAVTVKAFILTVLAGVGSMRGLIVAGIILGVGEALTVSLASASFRELFGFLLFLVILIIRPAGLFGRRL